MDVSLTLIVIMAVLFACGVYAMLERSLTRVLIGFLLLGNATNLLLLIVMGVPGSAPFYGVDGDISDPLPQALTLTAIVITFAVSAFLLALIYRSWQLGQADTVEDDEADIALRERTDADEDLMDDESESDDDEATTDFVGVQTAPITVLHMRDHASIQDDAPVDRAYGSYGSDESGSDQGGSDQGGSDQGGSDQGGSDQGIEADDQARPGAADVLDAESAPPDDEDVESESGDDADAEASSFRTDADTHAADADETDAADAARDTAFDPASDDNAPEHTDEEDRR